MRPDLQQLVGYLEAPLGPDEKIPLSHAQWKALMVTESIPTHACRDEDLELLFKQSEDETAVAILDLVTSAITRSSVNPAVPKSRLFRSGIGISETFSSNAWVLRVFGVVTRVQKSAHFDLILVCYLLMFVYSEVKKRELTSRGHILKRTQNQDPVGV